MTVFEVFAYVAGLALSATKLLNTAKPYWSKLPKVIATVLPSVVVVLPALAAQLTSLQTEGDLKMLGLTVLALLLPGAGFEPKPAEPPATEAEKK